MLDYQSVFIEVFHDMSVWQPKISQTLSEDISDTVDGRNPKQPPGMYKTL